MVTPNQNQFNITPVAGMLMEGSSIAGQFYSATVDETIAAGIFATLSATPNGSVTRISKGTDEKSAFYGMVLFKPRKSVFAVGDIVEVAKIGSVVIATGGEVITAGDKLMFAPATGKVMKWTIENTIVGVALENGGADVDFRMQVQGF